MNAFEFFFYKITLSVNEAYRSIIGIGILVQRAWKPLTRLKRRGIHSHRIRCAAVRCDAVLRRAVPQRTAMHKL